MKKIAIILTNLGTPETATKTGITKFLREFLSDRRVVEAPAFIWWFILRLIVIPLRAKKVTKAYQAIWWEEGSPIKVIGLRQVKALQEKLNTDYGLSSLLVAEAVTYGTPSIKETIEKLKVQGIEKFIVLPMYPQYSCSTTGAIYDQIAHIMKTHRDVPDISTIKSFYDHPGYIKSLAESVTHHWQQHGKNEKLLMSFHGIPQEYADKGDPYPEHCYYTANALAKELNLKDTDWALCFQSRFGPKQWLKPYTEHQLKKWLAEGIKTVDIISPAFTADCLETLEEININYRALFTKEGGVSYHYIPCVNDSKVFINTLADLIKQYI